MSVPFCVPDGGVGGSVRVDAPPGWVVGVVAGPPSAGVAQLVWLPGCQGSSRVRTFSRA